MKEIRAKNRHYYGEYQVEQIEINRLVPASIYKEIPDYEELKKDLEQGHMDWPLVVFEADLEYWQGNHKQLYGSGNPDLPWDNPPLVGDKIYIVWQGRQRLQILKDLGYTHVDIVKDPVFHRMLRLGNRMKKGLWIQ